MLPVRSDTDYHTYFLSVCNKFTPHYNEQNRAGNIPGISLLIPSAIDVRHAAQRHSTLPASTKPAAL